MLAQSFPSSRFIASQNSQNQSVKIIIIIINITIIIIIIVIIVVNNIIIIIIIVIIIIIIYCYYYGGFIIPNLVVFICNVGVSVVTFCIWLYY